MTDRAETWPEWWRRCGEAELNLILWAAWDPIGDVPRDEYDSYAPRIASLLRRDATAGDIEEQLEQWRTGRIGLPADRVTDRVAAAKIFDWYTNPFDDIHPRPSELKD